MNVFKKAANFLKEVKTELGKVSWSSRKELIGATSVVISITFIMAVFIGAIDIVLSKCLRLMFR